MSPRNINQLQILIDSGYKIANIDHHSLRKDLPQDLILINPMQIDKKKSKNASTSSVLLDIARYHLDINNKWWNNFVFLAKIGNIGDNKREYILTEKNRNKLLKVAEFLNTVGGTTNNSISYDGKKLILEKLVSILVNSSSPEEFWENLSSHQELKTRFEEINKSVKTELIAIEQKRKSNTSSLTIHHFKNEQFGINETVLKQHLELLDLQEKTKPSTILLIFKDTDKYVVSLYSTDPKITESKNHSCSAICIEIGKKFGLGGGGHKHRAGASLPLDKLNEAIALIKSLFSIVTANHS